VEKNSKGNILDVGKSRFWDYGFDTIDNNEKLNPTIIGNIEKTDFDKESYDMILCNGMYECVNEPQKMVDEVFRILKQGGLVIFGFVGKDYQPYKKDWQYYDNNIDFHGYEVSRKNFNNEYHFIICRK
jgi:ubiquinone/menaquinone biosynthesis C-methylase UbiE